ncbi:Mobile element protein [Candidatus Enterovibrio altilux]|uniref:Mobile element protein n=1 Tax=Candidatus Enterovibrio altilux TaxID=1927128 RepID=A0A291B7R2_9GAMM|nr:Mobile element protein [Candidatus Enterovibrio luxaltus]
MSYPHYLCISKRSKTVNVRFKMKNKGAIQHLAISATGPESTVKANGT